jgi:hypothetical protein
MLPLVGRDGRRQPIVGLFHDLAHMAEPEGRPAEAAVARVLAAWCAGAGCKRQSQLCLMIDVYIHASHVSTPHMQSGVIRVKIVQSFFRPDLAGDFADFGDFMSILGDINACVFRESLGKSAYGGGPVYPSTVLP